MGDKIRKNSPSTTGVRSEMPIEEHGGSPRPDAILAIDGQGLKRLIEASLAWLRNHQAAINALNVFPVPDGDTGTNMLLTMQSAWDEIADSPEKNAGLVAHAVAHGALMGARGNSGVILSQLWRGFARSLDNKQTFGATDLADAMQEASETGYKGVIKPVEGTILTVAREAANAAQEITHEYSDLVAVLDYIVGQTKQAVARTPSQLPVLAEAGVVDAGGQGLYVILEAMLRYVRGETIAVDEALDSAVDLRADRASGWSLPGELTTGIQERALAGSEITYGYDVQYILVGQNLDVDRIRDEIDAVGDSTLVVGDAGRVKVHVHVSDPGIPISCGAKWGALHDVVVEDMQSQYQKFILGRTAPPVTGPTMLPSEVSTVTVVPGDGLVRVFESLGAGVVISGGQTMNPSTEQILEAIQALPTEKILVLPNNGNIVMAAEQAAGLSTKHVIVVPTRTIPQGIAALLALNYQADLETNAELLRAAAEDVESGEITTATRSVEIDGVKVETGEIIGLVNERLVASGPTVEHVMWPMLDAMGLEDREILTLYFGNGVNTEQADHLAAKISERFPDQEIELVDGGQPHYHYILSVE